MTSSNFKNNSNKRTRWFTNITLLRESQITKIHYITGISALFVVAIHILMRLIMPFNMSLEFENVILNYKNIFYALLLESILVLIAYTWLQWPQGYLTRNTTDSNLGKGS